MIASRSMTPRRYGVMSKSAWWKCDSGAFFRDAIYASPFSIHGNYFIKLCVRALKRNGLMVAFCTTVLVALPSNDKLVQLSIVQTTRGKPQNRGYQLTFTFNHPAIHVEMFHTVHTAFKAAAMTLTIITEMQIDTKTRSHCRYVTSEVDASILCT